jgi:L-2-hydroxyglutarate oxidase LhgO
VRMPDFGVTVIGGGAVGLAVAARLAARGDVLLLERHAKHGMETSSRNSEVIHAGIYYPEGSWKARMCVRGNRLLYERCAARGIAHRRITKIITAVDDKERPGLEKLYTRGCANGAPLEMITGERAREMEPYVKSIAAIFSPSTGVVSAHEYMDELARSAEADGALVKTRSEVVGIEKRPGEYHLTLRSAGEEESVTTERVVNSAGLDADRIAEMAGIDVDAAGYRLYYAKGSYFALSPRKWGLVSRLVYPVPGNESLGVHAVIDVAGRVRFGPDVEYLPGREIDYGVKEGLREAFGEAARRYLPEIEDQDLTPDISGVRAKLQKKGEPVRDFVIEEESARGLPGFVNLIGIDSPGLTSSLAIADHVASLVG